MVHSHSARCAFALVVGLVVSACVSTKKEAPPEPVEAACAGRAESELRACLTDYFFKGYPALVESDCVPGGSTTLGRSVDTQLFEGAGITDVDVQLETWGLARYYEGYGLSFTTGTPVTVTSLGYLMTGTEQDLDTAVMNAGVPLHGPYTDEQQQKIDQAVGGVLFATLRSFVLLHTPTPAAGQVNLVIVEELVAPETAKALELDGVLAGLGLSPALLDDLASDDPNKDLYKLIGLPPDFAPTLFVGHKSVETYLGATDLVISHEMGHALGLKHDPTHGNLMNQGNPGACRPVLDDAQLGELAGVKQAADSLGSDSLRRLLRAARLLAARRAARRAP